VAKEIPFARTFVQSLRSRFQAWQYGYFRSILDSVIPTVQVGRDFSDIERPQWGIYSYASRGGVGLYVSSTITSAVDIAIEGLHWSSWYRSSGNVAQDQPLVVLNPPVSWIPFALNPVSWFPGIRPRIEFDPGRTVVITGDNANIPPYWGLALNPNVFELSFAPAYFAANNWHVFNPPLILPATMFLTCSIPSNLVDLEVSWRYREIG
jgi:hypothetical protein